MVKGEKKMSRYGSTWQLYFWIAWSTSIRRSASQAMTEDEFSYILDTGHRPA